MAEESVIYPELIFPEIGRPFFYSNFVTTLDGKAFVDRDGYWPIGSAADHSAMRELRAHADVLIHGRRTASVFRTVDSLTDRGFREMRAAKGRTADVMYVVVSDHPDETLRRTLRNEAGFRTVLVTASPVAVTAPFRDVADIVQTKPGGAVQAIVADLKARGLRAALIEGGPHLLGSFVVAGLLDQIFLTLSPKLFGSLQNVSLTMIEGVLIEPTQVPAFTLLSARTVGDELFLRYAKAAGVAR